MNFSWSPESQRRIREAEAFAKSELFPSRLGGGFPHSNWKACAHAGYVGLTMPETWGGSGCNSLTAAGVFESLGSGGADRGLLFALGAHLFGVSPVLARLGSATQQALWGPQLCRGETIAALAITEPEGGSSVHMATTAEESGDGFLIQGEKTFVTNGPDAGLFLLIAATSPRHGAMGLSAFLIPRETPGLEVESLGETLGMRAAPMSRVVFRNARVSRDTLLGKPGNGLAALNIAMQSERSLILAGFLGAAERDLAACVTHLNSRHGAAGTLLDYQATAHRLARVKAKLESARWLLYHGAWSLDQEKEPMLTSAIVKLTLSEALTDCALDILKCYGGAGWTDSDGTATALRDVVGTLSASGTNDIQLNIIASALHQSNR